MPELSYSEVSKRIESQKALIEHTKNALEILKRQRAVEAAKREPLKFRLEKMDAEIREAEELLKRTPDTIEELERQLKQTETEEKNRDAAVSSCEKLVPRMQKLTKQLAALLKQAEKVNEELISLNNEINQIEKEYKVRVYKPFVSVGFKSLETLLSCIEAEARGEKRPMLFWPAGRNWPL